VPVGRFIRANGPVNHVIFTISLDEEKGRKGTSESAESISSIEYRMVTVSTRFGGSRTLEQVFLRVHGQMLERDVA
jgi:hypothetical protein